jgi:hypothetical protein
VKVNDIQFDQVHLICVNQQVERKKNQSPHMFLFLLIEQKEVQKKTTKLLRSVSSLFPLYHIILFLAVAGCNYTVAIQPLKKNKISRTTSNDN